MVVWQYVVVVLCSWIELRGVDSDSGTRSLWWVYKNHYFLHLFFLLPDPHNFLNFIIDLTATDTQCRGGRRRHVLVVTLHLRCHRWRWSFFLWDDYLTPHILLQQVALSRGGALKFLQRCDLDNLSLKLKQLLHSSPHQKVNFVYIILN